ncbi:hypothetical protein [Bordetella sp. 15P40C-2]|uniref:hypothetical protein n=1 Tax=Bordetella sp. 15P40C-2 TaxID=2572246 RepID=UPI00192375D0|nr:hypothetical protein [Bordetella sp. 15P40C-2]
MTLSSRFGIFAGSTDPKANPSDKPQDKQSQQQKDDAARKQAQSDPNKQRTPQ